MRFRYDERCFGLCKRSAGAADRPVQPAVIRTAEMMDIMCLVFVRGKRPDEKMIELARERGICLLATPHTMFTACGILYKAGLVGGA